MKTTEKIGKYFQMIEEINYYNKNGGAYAYVQFLSYTREVLILLQPVKKIHKQIEAIESINQVFNECLTVRFTDHQKIIFDAKRRELKTIFETLKDSLIELEVKTRDKLVYDGMQDQRD
jgi:hypothetical protein